MSIDVGNEVRQGTAKSIDIRFRFVERPQRLVIDGLLQRIRGMTQIIAFADVANPVYYEASSSINRDRALKESDAMGQLDLRRV